MHDIKIIRDNPAGFDAGLARRGLEPLSAAIGEEDARWRAVSTALATMSPSTTRARRSCILFKLMRDTSSKSSISRTMCDS